MKLTRIFRQVYLFSACLILAGCASISTNDFDPSEHGFVVGRISLHAEDAYAIGLVRELYTSFRKDNNIIIDAFQVRLEKNQQALTQTVSFSYALQAGNYRINRLVLLTSGLTFETEKPLPVTFTIQPGEVNYIGDLVVAFGSQEGTFTKVMNRRVQVLHQLDHEQDDLQQFVQKNPQWIDLPVVTTRLFDAPVKVKLVPYERNAELRRHTK